jgi:hypothetical protein
VRRFIAAFGASRVNETTTIALAELLLLVAACAPLIGLGWMMSMLDRRTSIKEIMAYVAHWGVVFALVRFAFFP